MARSLSCCFQRSTAGKSEVFCLLEGGVEGDEPKFDSVGLVVFVLLVSIAATAL